MMKRRRNLFSLLGVSMLLLASTAAFASSAQASGNGLFLINLASVSGTQVVEGLGGSGKLIWLGVELECLHVHFEGLLTSNLGTGIATFLECRIPNSDVCLVDQTIETNEIEGELRLLGSVVKFSPTGANFAEVSFTSHEELCVFFLGEKEKWEITGEICAIVTGNELELQLSSAHCSGLQLGESEVTVHSNGNKIPIVHLHGVPPLPLKVTTHA